jgi:hypothetical protein
VRLAGSSVQKTTSCSRHRPALPKREPSLAACRLAALVFRSAPCSSQGQALTPEHAEAG